MSSLDTGNIFKFEIAADTLAITMDENSKVESITRSYRLEEKTE